MGSKLSNEDLLEELIKISYQAGEKIMEIYESSTPAEMEVKGDGSPLTSADLASNEYIVNGLTKLNLDIPIISEEGKSIPYEERKDWDKFWLVDPLDGTKEFIKRNGEFTTNIALIDNGTPTMGVV